MLYRILLLFVFFMHANATIAINIPQPGQLQFSMSSFTAERTQGSIPIVVNRAKGSDGKVSVNIRYDGNILKTLTWQNGDATSKVFIAGVNKNRTGHADLSLSNFYGGAKAGKLIKTRVHIIDPLYNGSEEISNTEQNLSQPLINSTPSDVLSVYVQPSNSPAFSNELLSYTIIITSNGNVNNAVLTVSLPVNVTVNPVDNCGNSTFSEGILTCYLTLGQGVTTDSRIITLIPNTSEDITIIAEVRTDGEIMFDSNSSNNFQILTTSVLTGERYYRLGDTIGQSETRFHGAVLNDDSGESLQGLIPSSYTIDMNIWFELDPAHINQPGGIITVAMLDDILLQRTDDGSFIPWDGHFESLILNTAIKPLGALEVVHLFDNLSLNGTEGHQILVIAGYFIEGEEVIYYHEKPLELKVSQ